MTRSVRFFLLISFRIYSGKLRNSLTDQVLIRPGVFLKWEYGIRLRNTRKKEREKRRETAFQARSCILDVDSLAWSINLEMPPVFTCQNQNSWSIHVIMATSGLPIVKKKIRFKLWTRCCMSRFTYRYLGH